MHTRVLVVEDHPAMRHLIRCVLGGTYEVAEAPSAAAALGLADQFRPVIALVDLLIPGSMNGLELCRHLKRQPSLRGIRTVLLSALSDAQERAREYPGAVDIFMRKPFRPLDLLETLEELATGEPAVHTVLGNLA